MQRGSKATSFESPGGFALISTLLVVVLVTVIAVSFLAAVGAERVTAGAYGNITRARFSAEAAMESGLARMATLLGQHPGGVTMWEERGGLAATVFYLRTVEDEEKVTRVAPLLSGVEETTAAQWRAGEPALELAYKEKGFEDPANSVDINLPRHAAEQSGWIGSPAGEARREIRVPWVELRTREGVLTGRYAYWIEDESFKVPFNHIKDVERGAGTPGIEPEEIPLQGVLAEVAARLGSRDSLSETAHRIITLRDAMLGGRLRDWNAFNSLPAFSGSSGSGIPLLGEQLRYYGTLFSESANLTSSGARRLDLNTLFVPEVGGEEGTARQQVDRAVAAIRHHSPTFGERFYPVARGAEHPEEHQTLYLEKLAVNIRDSMMPPGLPPTMLWEPGEQPPAGRPQKGIEPMIGSNVSVVTAGPNPARAVGKKNLPYLQEWACHVRLLKFDEKKGSHADFEFMTHFYLEFWNMSPVDIDTGRGDLGENPFIRLYNLPAFDIGSAGPMGFPGDFVEIPLNNVVFKAGRATVLTTALPAELNTALVSQTPADAIISIATPASQRLFTGKTDSKVTAGYRINLIARTKSSTDYETFFLMGNDAGLLDSVVGLGLARGQASSSNALSLHNDKKGDAELDTVNGLHVEQYYVRGGSLRGSSFLQEASKAAQTGDPRSSNEQLFFRLYDESGDEEQTRYYNSGLDNPSASKGTFYVPATSSLGRWNAPYVEPEKWPDAFSWSSDLVDTPTWYPAGPLRSIGELGHVYDPARIPGPTGNILYSRGGGRTLAIGQPDSLQTEASASGANEAWRLVDLFATSSELLQPGRININGLLRDDGVAFRALFSGYSYEQGASGDPGLAGKALASERLEAIISSMQAHLEEHGPYFERGAYSEALGGESNAAYDRGREELFRRSVELTTTRGSIFTLYAIGEAVRETPSGALARGAVSRLKVTFRVVPVWNEAVEELFDPADPASVADRFRPPDRYAIEIVQVE